MTKAIDPTTGPARFALENRASCGSQSCTSLRVDGPIPAKLAMAIVNRRRTAYSLPRKPGAVGHRGTYRSAGGAPLPAVVSGDPSLGTNSSQPASYSLAERNFLYAPFGKQPLWLPRMDSHAQRLQVLPPFRRSSARNTISSLVYPSSCERFIGGRYSLRTDSYFPEEASPQVI